MRGIATILSATAVSLLLSGCLFRGAEELYTLPELSRGYMNLQEEVEKQLSQGLGYAAPISGDNAQPIQFHDLDGDGVTEALAFFRAYGTNENEPSLKICIYQRDENRTYSLVAELQGAGEAIHSVEYVELNGTGTVELAVNYQISDQVYTLSVYGLEDFTPTLLMQSDCTSYTITDLENDGIGEVIVLHADAAEQSENRAEWYVSNGAVMECLETAPLSAGMQSISRTRSSNLVDGTPAVYVTGAYMEEGQLVTDIIALRNGVLTNLTWNEATNVSDGTLRDDPAEDIFATDLNGDGVYEIPVATEMTELGSHNLWKVDWISFTLDGSAQRICTTLCAPQDGAGWYLELPDSFWESFSGTLGAYRDEEGGQEELVITLYDYSGATLDEIRVDQYQRLLSIYVLSGANRGSRAAMDGRTVLYESAERVYAYALEEASGLTQEQVEACFHFMPTSWSD